MRQVINIDITFDDTYTELKTQELLKILVEKYAIKNISITNTNKKKDK